MVKNPDVNQQRPPNSPNMNPNTFNKPQSNQSQGIDEKQKQQRIK